MAPSAHLFGARSRAVLYLFITSLASGTAQEEGLFTSTEASRGQIGTRVTIQGTKLLGSFGGTSIIDITLAGVPAAITQGNSSDAIIVVAQRGTGRGEITVIGDSGATAVREDAWIYLEEGGITSFSPATGQLGTVVTMSGSHMLGGGTTVSEILFGSAAATIVSASDIELVAAVPAQAAGSVPVTVTVDTGATVQSVLQRTYAEQGAVPSTDPASGQHGTTVVVSGTNLLGHGQSLTSITLAGVVRKWLATRAIPKSPSRLG